MTTDLVRILLVEDNPYDAELTLDALGTAHVANDVQLARDGVEALDFLFGQGDHAGRDPNETPTLVLLDLKLPRLNGIEVLRRLRADPRTQTVPVVVLTSSAEDPDIKMCYELGVNSYIVKPVDFEQFSETVRLLGLYWSVHNRPPCR